MKKLRPPSNMKVRRITMGLSQEYIASKLGMAISSVGGIERGDNPAQKDVAERVAGILGTKVSTIFKPHPTLKERFVVF